MLEALYPKANRASIGELKRNKILLGLFVLMNIWSTSVRDILVHLGFAEQEEG